MAEPVLFDYVGSAQRGYDQGRARKQASNLQQLAGQYYAGDQSPELLSQIAQNGGDAGALRQESQGQRDRALKEFGQLAGYLASLPDEASRAQAFQSMRSKFAPVSQSLGLPPVPESWDEKFLPHMQAMAQSYGGQGQQQETFSNAGNGFMLGNRGTTRQIPGYSQNGAAGKSRVRPVSVPDGQGGSRMMLFNPDTQEFSEPNFSGQPQPQANTFEPSIYLNTLPPAERQAAEMAMRGQPAYVQGGQAIPGSTLSPQGQLGYKPPSSGPGQRQAPAGYRWKGDALEVIPGGPADRSSATSGARSVKDPTEDQSKAGAWFAQATNAYGNLKRIYERNPDAANPGIIETYSPLDEVANRSRSADRQQYVQAASSLSEAFLRAATGAGITIDEAKQKFQELTPVRGDSPEVIKQKLDAIPVYLEALKNRAGRAIRSPSQPTAADADARLPPLGGPPQAGSEENGYRFKGGDPADPNSWEKL